MFGKRNNSTENISEVVAVGKALHSAGFKYDLDRHVWALNNESGEVTIVVPRPNARTFAEVQTIVGSMTFNRMLPQEDRVLCGRVALILGEHSNQFIDDQGARILENV